MPSRQYLQVKTMEVRKISLPQPMAISATHSGTTLKYLFRNRKTKS